MPLSARHPAALAALARSYSQLLARLDAPSLQDVCYSAAVGRAHHNYRLALVARYADEMVAELAAFAERGGAQSGASGRVPAKPQSRPVFVFTGMGPQWWGMGAELLGSEPAFRQAAVAVDELFRSMSGWSILDEMRRDEATSRTHEAQVAQPANFLLQVGLASLLRSWGIVPEAVVGHSAGEAAAAYVAGLHDLPDAVRVIYHRSRLQQQATGKGCMLAVGLGLNDARALIAGREHAVTIAAHNSSSSVALSGRAAVLDEIAADLERQAVFNRFLHGGVPYHSPEMDLFKPELRRALADIGSKRPHVPLYSSVTGRLVEDTPFDADYWCDNIREPVLFAEAVESILARGHTTFLEVGPHPVLSASIKELLLQHGSDGHVLACLRRGQPEGATIRAAVCGLYVSGQSIDWRNMADNGARRVKLPTYPWQRERLWFAESPASIAYRRGPVDHPILGTRMIDPEPSWESELTSSALGYLKDHTVEGTVVFPGAGYVELALAIHGALDMGKSAVVEDLDFRQALVVTPETLQLIRSRFDERARECSIYSRDDSGSTEWTLHARGRIAEAPPAPKRIALEEIRHTCSEEIPVEKLYGSLAGHGLSYGPSFQRVERLWRADGQAVACLKPLESSDVTADGYRLHPTLLDGSIQCIVAAIGMDHLLTGPYVPVGIRRVTWSGRTSMSWWAYVHVVERSDTAVEANIVICDEEGSVLAELLGVRCQLLPSSRQSRADSDDRMYLPEWVQADRPGSPTSANHWLIFADDYGYGNRLAGDLKAFNGGLDVEVVPRQELAMGAVGSLDGSRFSRIFSEKRGIDRVVYLWPLDEAAESADPSGSEAVPNFLHLVQALVKRTDSPPPRLYVVTKGAQSVDGEAVSGLAHTPVIGLARTALMEYPELRCTVVDLDPSCTPETAADLARELLGDSPDTETALRNTGRYVYRLARFSTAKHAAEAKPLTAAEAESFRLEIGKPGRLETLRFHQIRREPPRRGEVEIRVLAAALNFKDVLKATGFLPAKAVEGTYHRHGLGMEAAGVISAVGEGVGEYAVGDAVVASVPNSFSSHVTVPIDRLFGARKLDTMSFVEAASVPVTFMTAYYALHELARLRPGETVLIHAAAGGVGLAAIQVAKWLGATVIGTAGNEEKRAYILSLGVQHALNSRTLEFADEIMALTGGRGVDVVLNSLPGEAFLKSLSIVAPLGRFVEIGKRDIIENNRLPMMAFNKNLSLIALDLDRIMVEQPDRIRALFDDVWNRFRAGDFRPTRMEVFPASQISDAFRRMAQSKQIGKIVVSFEDLDGVSVVPQRIAKDLVRADASYMITGGAGGFGLEVAKWLAAEGARHLVLCGRSGARTERAQDVIRALEAQGVDVRVCTVDVSDEVQLVDCLSSIDSMRPLRGIVHAAGVLDDAFMLNLDRARLLRVMAPKARGAWLLHKHTRHLPLDFFVLFSSVSSLVGTPGQANYVAANAYLDALAHHRHAMGLPATSINWGALADVGMASENQQVAAHLARAGIKPIAPRDAVRALALALERDVPQVGFIDADWQTWRQFCGSAAESPKFAGLLERGSSAPAKAFGRVHAALAEAAPRDRPEIAALALAELIGDAMRTAPDKIDLQAPLTEMGIDSLTALELQLAIETRFGVRCSVLELQKADGIRGLSQRLVSQMGFAAELMN